MGGLNVLELNSRMAIRAEFDPNDKSTIVSIYPGEVIQNHATIQPGYFQIKPGSFESPSLLTIGSSSWWKMTGEDEPPVEISHRSISVAKSVIMDWCNGMIEFNGEECMPGLFFAPGELDIKTIRLKYSQELLKAKIKQETWFKALIRRADSLWARSNGNPLSVADVMKMACRALGQDRPWLRDFEQDSFEKCIACQTVKPTSAVVCSTCGVITNPEKAAAMGLKFVSK